LENGDQLIYLIGLIQKKEKFGQKETHWSWFIRVELSIVLRTLHLCECDWRSSKYGAIGSGSIARTDWTV